MAQYPQIPRGIEARKKFLRKELKQFQGSYYCPALRQRVFVLHSSIKETAWHASRSVLSTKLALRLPYIIANAKVLELHQPPKDNHQKSRFHLVEIGNLTCGIRGLGTANLTIECRASGEMIEYCITGFKAHAK